MATDIVLNNGAPPDFDVVRCQCRDDFGVKRDQIFPPELFSSMLRKIKAPILPLSLDQASSSVSICRVLQ